MQSGAVADGNGKYASVDLGLADRICFCLIISRILAEQLTHSGDICTVSSQKGSRLKGSYTSLCHKVIGIDHNTGIHAVRFFSGDLNALPDILQDLGNHLTGRRRIRLHIRKGGIFNDLCSLSVMIQYHNGFTHSKELRTLCNAWPVYIHYHKNGVASGKLHCLLIGNDHIFLIVLMAFEKVYHGL